MKVLLAQPCYGGVEPESYHAAMTATKRKGEVRVSVMRPKASLLAHAFNLAVAYALNNNFEYFAMLHGDIAPDEGWLDGMLDTVNSGQYDVIHAVSPIKDSRGVTSTAIGYEDDEFGLVRRLTMAEAHKLPVVFGINDIRETIDADADRLLPNTGCLVMRADTWFRDFPGFTINDRVMRAGEEWAVDVCSEDWQFGHWCHKSGITVGGTLLKLLHFGRTSYDTSKVWGWEVDQHWEESKQQLQGATICE